MDLSIPKLFYVKVYFRLKTILSNFVVFLLGFFNYFKSNKQHHKRNEETIYLHYKLIYSTTIMRFIHDVARPIMKLKGIC